MEPSICVATPVHGKPHSLYNESLHRIMLSGAIKNYYQLVGGMVHISRNNMVDWALDHGNTHIWFIDADQYGFDAEMLKGLLAHDVDVVAPLVFMRHSPYEPVLYYFDERGWARSIVEYPRKSFFEVCAVGMGCCLIKASVFGKIEWPWFHPSVAVGRRWIGEDIMFCNLARKAGFKIYADTNYCVSHVAEWPMNETTWELIQKLKRLRSERAKGEEGKS